MSGPRFSIIPALAVTDTRLDGWALRVLALLGRHTNEQGWCTRSQAKMAEELAVSRPLVNRCVRDLVSCGYVETVSKGRVLKYRVRHDLTDAEIAEATEAAVSTCQPADIDPKEPVSPLTSGPDLSPVLTSDVTLRDTERTPYKRDDDDAVAPRVRDPASHVIAAVNHPLLDPAKSQGLILSGGEVARWMREGATLDEITLVVGAVMSKRKPAAGPVQTWAYFNAPVRQHVAERLAPDQPIQPAIRTEAPTHEVHFGDSQRRAGKAHAADVYGILAERARRVVAP